MTRWLALDYGCAPLREKAEWNDGQASEKRLVSLAPGHDRVSFALLKPPLSSARFVLESIQSELVRRLRRCGLKETDNGERKRNAAGMQLPGHVRHATPDLSVRSGSQLVNHRLTGSNLKIGAGALTYGRIPNKSWKKPIAQMRHKQQPAIAMPKTRSTHNSFPPGNKRLYSRSSRRVLGEYHPNGENWLSFGSLSFTWLTIS